jgi:hypothetical protein
VTRKNDRNIYTKSDKGTSQYLSIDTENGTFELFDYLGHHKGEFDFNYVRTENPKGHSITVK